MILAAHQPNFFPWLGFFNKIHRSDVFVLLDDVQMIKTGSSWFNRVFLLINGEARYVTIPLERPSGKILIKDARIIDLKWKKRLISTMELSYGRHPFFKTYFPDIKKLIDDSDELMYLFNRSVISHFLKLLEFSSNKIVLSSEIGIQTMSTQRLIDLTKSMGCATYLEGGGASGYQEDSLFPSQGVSLLKQNFVQQEYPQKGSPQFIPGLSILDALFNCGIDGTKKLIISCTE